MAPHVTRHVLVTDYAWPSLEIERDGLGKIGAELVVASTGQEEELQARAYREAAAVSPRGWASIPRKCPGLLAARAERISGSGGEETIGEGIRQRVPSPHAYEP